MPETGEPKKVAIYGGSFNPPHICHQITVLYLLQTCDIDEVWLMPCFRHAFDKRLAPFEMRVKWCKALASPFTDKCLITDVEQNLAAESRTIDTMAELEKLHPEIEFSLVLGSDIRAEKHKWKKFDELERKYKIHWFGRMGQGENQEDLIVLPDISSTLVRKILTENNDASKLVPAEVLKLVLESGLF